MVHPGAVGHAAHVGDAADVAGVDAHLGDAALDGADGQIVAVVDVRHQRHGGAVDDGGQGVEAGLVIDGQAHDVAARLGQSLDLRKGRLRVAAVGVGHALNGYGRAAANGQAADMKSAGVAHDEKPPWNESFSL